MSINKFIRNTNTRTCFNYIVENLDSCAEFKISVAFITFGGLQVLLDTLEILRKKGIPGQILTTTYQQMTTPEVLERIAEFENIQLKIYVPPTEEDGFHAKGYLFKKQIGNDNWSIIIGSTNITGRALKTNVEWNILHSDSQPAESSEFTKNVLNEFNSLWNSPYAKEYSEDFLNAYKEYLQQIKKTISAKHIEKIFSYDDVVIKPNEMQNEAIVKLAQLRDTGAKKALAIAATGSGKTYMSVFDSVLFKPNRLLFIVHREDILNKAKESFKKIYSSIDNSITFGSFTGNFDERDCKFVFATRDKLSRHYTEFKPDEFDYIILDEAHHAASPQYENILKYFRPKFLLGLTATPERTDGQDIYSIFDNNIAVEIRLRQALQYNLVCPFHYFGLKDADGIDYAKITATPGTKEYIRQISDMLMVGRRVDYIISKLKFYSHDGEKAKVLGFCASVEHAEYMATEFNKRLSANGDDVAVALSGNDDIPTREKYAKRLENENDVLQYIFTVDIFNEGIDIPSVNTVLMLRPTDSSIIFLQQLGRGLRKLPNKEFVTVLDFIGNYKNSFLMAIALHGSPNIDRDTLKVEVNNDFSDLPNGTYIHLDRITKEQILSQLEIEKFMSMKYMRESYDAFKNLNCGGKIPMLVDYLKQDGAVDPVRFTQFDSKYKTYIEFVAHVEKDTHPELSFALDNIVFSSAMRLFSFYCPAKRAEEWIILKTIFDSPDFQVSIDDVIAAAPKYLATTHRERFLHSAEVLSGKYFDSAELSKYRESLLNFEKNSISFSTPLKACLKDTTSKKWMSDLIHFSLLRYQHEFGSFDRPLPFLKLYHEYSMRDIALLCGYKKVHSAFRGQGLLTLDHPNYYIFVNLHKDAKVRESINYKDKFIRPDLFQWESPNSTSQDSEVGKNLIDNVKRGINLHLFVRKFEEVEGVTQPFVYLGEVCTLKDTVKNNKPIMMEFGLYHPVPDSIYNDFTTIVNPQKEKES
ncbi:DUF3427 domain-containing protein [Candidatus Saccharibacteria bacterium]|nr:DUF3427 domain-containing protein [Candidatus Saccharibacteria bacterium]